MPEQTLSQPENIRPWGRYDILDETEGFKVKRLTIKSGKRLSYQSHVHRTEVWTIVAGSGRTTLNDEMVERKRGDVIVIPAGTKHRLENTGTEPLVFIEVQVGDYFGEDDEIRYDDDYGRGGPEKG